MNYSSLIGDAWRTTKNTRYLWPLALFAGGATGAGTQNFGNRMSVDRPAEWMSDRAWAQRGDWRFEDASARAQTFLQGTAAWAVANAGWLVAGAVLVALLAVALIVLGLIARGGMAEATVDLATGQGSSLHRMWRAGKRLVWRYAGLWLVLGVAGLTLAALVGGTVAAGIGAAAATGMPGVIRGFGMLIAIPFALAAAAAAIALSIIVAYAERAIYAEDAGPIEALKSGWRVLRGNLATSALLWLLNVALSIGAGILLALTGMLVIGALGAAGAAMWFTTGWSAALFTYSAAGVMAVFAAALLACAVVNTFFWSFWSLAYVRLTGFTNPTPMARA